MRYACALLLVVLVGCAPGVGAPAGSGASEPEGSAMSGWPAGLTAYVDQSRLQRVGREAFVRLVHEGGGEVTVTRAEVVSDRFPRQVWTGEKTFTREADLDLQLPLGRCGTGSDARVRLTYRLGEGPEHVSSSTATDRYGAIGLLLDRDCTQRVLTEAADLEVGEGRVDGSGRDSRFVVPLRLTATGERPDVAYAGLEPTVLFRLADAGAAYGTLRPVAMTPGTVLDQELVVVPSRCDPHALAEDKVGTLFGVHVQAPDLPADAAFTLPLPDSTRAALRGFFGPHCGL